MISEVPGAALPPPAAPRHPLPPWGCRQGGSVLVDGAGTLGWVLARNWAMLRPRGQSAGQASLPAALPTAMSASPARPHPTSSAPSKESQGLGIPKPSEDRGGR